MHPLLAEVAPAAGALPPLVAIALLIVAFGIVWTIRKLTQALFGWLIDAVSWLPIIGGDAAKLLRYPEQAVANVLGKAEHAIDGAIGASWHLLARYMDWVWRELRGHAVLLVELASGLYPLAVAIRWAKTHILHLNATSSVSSAKVKTLERELHGIDRELRTLQKEWRGIDATGVGKRLGRIEAEVGTIETQTIPVIQQAENDAQSAISNLYEWAKGKASLLGVGTFTTAVAAVLSAVGLDWLACRSRNNVNGKSGCALWDDIEGLLLTAGIFGAALDFRDIVKAAVEVESLGAEAVTALASLAEDAVDDAAQVIADAVNAIAA